MNPDRTRQDMSLCRFRTSLLASLVTVVAAVLLSLTTASASPSATSQTDGTLAGKWLNAGGGVYDFTESSPGSYTGYVVDGGCASTPGDIKDTYHGNGYYTGTENTFSSTNPCVVAGTATNTIQIAANGKTARWVSAGVCSDCGPETWTRLATAPVASPAGAVPGLAKSYTGSAHNTTASETGGLELTSITQNGAAIAGTVAFEAPLSGSGPFTGTVSATAVHFTAKLTGATVVFTGEVWPIVSMSGSWVAHTSSGSQFGTWGVGSTWNGTVHNNTNDVTGSMSLAQLTESAGGRIAGTFLNPDTTAGGASVAPVTGTLHGDVVRFAVVVNCTESTFVGTLSALGGMSGTWSYPGSKCNNSNGPGNGPWSLQRAGAASAI